MVRMVAVLSLGAVLTLFEATVVNVALESIGADLRLSVASTQWIGSAYLLALTFGVPLGGWANGRFGDKHVWIAALATFLLGSLLCGLSWSAESLTLFRVLQGFGGGMVLPVGQSIIVRATAPERLGRTMGVMSMPLLVGPALGPLFGGALVTYLGWRWVFLINLPVGVLTLAAAARVLQNRRTQAQDRLDLVGLALLPPGVVLVIYGLSALEPGSGGLAVAVGCIGAGFASLALYVRHALRRGRTALIDLALFGRREFVAAAGVAVFSGMTAFAGFFLLGMYFQVVHDESAVMAGLLMSPQGLGSLLALPLAGRLSDRIGAGRVVPFGLLIGAAATTTLAFASEDTPYALEAVALFLRGIGISSVMTPSMAAAFRALEPDAIPRATATINILSRVGAAIGLGVLALVLSAGISEALPPGMSSTGLHGLETLPAELRSELYAPFSHGFLVLAGAGILSLIPASLLPRRRQEVQV